MSAFDPQDRRRLLTERLLDESLAGTYTNPFGNGAMWNLGDVIHAIIVGLGDDPRVAALRDKARDGIAAALATDRPLGEGPLRHRAELRAALAVARWMETTQIDKQLLVDAVADLETFISTPNRVMNNTKPARLLKPDELVKGKPSYVDTMMLLACVAGDHAKAIACYDARVSAPSAGTVRDFAIQLARGVPDLAAAADRMLASNVYYALENHSPIDVVLQLYLGYVAIGRAPTDPRGVIERAVHHVKYLKPREPKAKKAVVVAPPPTRPAPTHALPGPAVTDPSIRAARSPAELSGLAKRATPVPLEVCCARLTGNSLGGVPIKLGVSFDKRKDWKEALNVGALVNLRALSISLVEEERERIARGSEPRSLAPDWFWASPLAQQLEVLDVYVGEAPHALSRWQAHFATCARLQAINIRMYSSRPATPTRHSHDAVVSFVLTRERLTLQTSFARVDDDVLETSRPFLETFPKMPVVLEYVTEVATAPTALHRYLEANVGPVEVRGPCRYVEI